MNFDVAHASLLLEVHRLRRLVQDAYIEGVNAGGDERVAEDAWETSKAKKALDADTR